ncbi:MAG: DUF565 domain-containing protein [Candidatus Parcubacteria bacterium]|uniref:DUF565 domain-containing protein n=1 Tax=Phormidesmis priestleyi TaxID=268141 RepID=UPI00083AED8A|nr:DUF565 domain-containing protein [Phormidesmis priestleyi]MBC7824729.1 DUF565 domain-containing protein [Leptolyngbyaceae cyanobacterium LF-bin-113]
MQNTRLNDLVGVVTGQIGQLFQNPWRRASLLVISLLFGFYLGTAISTTTGQQAQLDIVVATILVVLTESVSRIIYGGSDRVRRSLPAQIINMLKIGITYSLFIDALKLGS